jgi:hypothetical protein
MILFRQFANVRKEFRRWLAHLQKDVSSVSKQISVGKQIPLLSLNDRAYFENCEQHDTGIFCGINEALDEIYYGDREQYFQLFYDIARNRVIAVNYVSFAQFIPPWLTETEAKFCTWEPYYRGHNMKTFIPAWNNVTYGGGALPPSPRKLEEHLLEIGADIMYQSYCDGVPLEYILAD